MDKKSTQLGIHYSTASARLDRMVLFMLVQQTGRDVCHRCGGKIERWQDLSTEHKEPWLDVDPALFWDLKNIAFSHKKCNYRAARPNGFATAERMNQIRIDRHKEAPEGMAWCFGHRRYLPRESFGRNKYFASGVQRYCNDCRAQGK